MSSHLTSHTYSGLRDFQITGLISCLRLWMNFAQLRNFALYPTRRNPIFLRVPSYSNNLNDRYSAKSSSEFWADHLSLISVRRRGAVSCIEDIWVGFFRGCCPAIRSAASSSRSFPSPSPATACNSSRIQQRNIFRALLEASVKQSPPRGVCLRTAPCP